MHFTAIHSPLCLAAMQTSYPEFVQLLLDQGANPNTPDTELGTPLFCACKANNPAAASILLNASMCIQHYVQPQKLHMCL